MTGDERDTGTTIDREEYDHGTDEYVSDCNKVPFSGSGTGGGSSGCLLLVIAWIAAGVAAWAAA